MPTAHRQKMIEAGHAEPHHGHDKKAVKNAASLAAEDQARLDALAEADKVAAKVAADALAEKRKAQAARHQAELDARKRRRR